MECLYILKQYFRYYSDSIPDIDDLRKFIVALIHLYLQLFLCTWIFNNSCKSFSYVLAYGINKPVFNKLIFDD